MKMILIILMVLITIPLVSATRISPIEWNIVKTGDERFLDVTYENVNETSTRFCIGSKSLIDYGVALVSKERNILEVPFEYKDDKDVVATDKFDLSSINSKEHCFFIYYKNHGKIHLKIGWDSIVIDAAAVTTALYYGSNENFCILGNKCHVGYEGGGGDLWYGNASYNNITGSCENDWNIKEVAAGTIEQVNMDCLSNGSLILSYIENQDLDMFQSVDEGVTWVGPFTVEDEVDIFDGPVGSGSDSNSIVHWCLIDDDDDLIYVNLSVLDAGRVISSADSDHCDLAVDIDDNVYIVITDGAGGDVDIMSSKDGYTTRNSINDTLGTVVPTLGHGISIAIQENGSIHTVSMNAIDLNYCIGDIATWNGGENSYSCEKVDTTDSYNPDISVNDRGDIFILYGSTVTQSGNIFLANKTVGNPWIAARTNVVPDASSGLPSIADSLFPISNRLPRGKLNFVYVYNADLWYMNLTTTQNAYLGFGSYNKTYYSERIDGVKANLTLGNGTFYSEIYEVSEVNHTNLTTDTYSWPGYEVEVQQISSVNRTGFGMQLCYDLDANGTDYVSGYNASIQGDTRFDSVYKVSGTASTYFDGDQDFMNDTNVHSDLDLYGNDITVNFWYRRNSTSTYRRIVTLYQDANNYIMAGYKESDESFLSGMFQSSNEATSYTSGDKSLNGVWVMYTGYYNSSLGSIDSSMVIYINGVKQNMTSHGGYGAGTKTGLTLGIRNDFTNSDYKGHLDGVAIWNRELTKKELSSLYNAGNGRSCNEIHNITKSNFKTLLNGNDEVEFNLTHDDKFVQFKFDIKANTTDSAILRSYNATYYNYSYPVAGACEAPTIIGLANHSTTNISTYIGWSCSEACSFSINLDSDPPYENGTLKLSHNQSFIDLINSTTYKVNLTVLKDDCFTAANNDTFNFTTAANVGAGDTTPPTYNNNQNNASSVTKVNGIVNFSINVSDETALKNITFYWNDTGSWAEVDSMVISGTTVPYNTTQTVTATRGNLICGNYSIRDSSDNENKTNQSCFTVANTAPTIDEFLYLRPNDGIVSNLNFTAEFKVEDADGDPTNCTLYINDTINSTDLNVTLNNINEINSSISSDGVYGWYINCTDFYDYTTTTIRTFTLDTTPPAVNIIYPTEGLNISSNSIDLNASAVDNINTSPMTFYWVINGTTNTTTASANTTFNASDGFYNLTLFVSDGLQNGSDNVSFTLDTTAPVCTLINTSPSDIDANSTGTYTAIVNCTDSTAINITSMIFTRTVMHGGFRANWTIRPPSNNKSDYWDLTKTHILRADERGEDQWYEFAGIFDNNHTYAASDQDSIIVTITNNSARTWATLNFTWNVQPAAFEQMVFINRGESENEEKKDYEVHKDNGLLVKFWIPEIDIMNYTISTFNNFNTSGVPSKEMTVYFCNSSFNLTDGVSPQDDNDNCAFLQSLSRTDVDGIRDYTSTNSSYVADSFTITNGLLSGINVTQLSYIYYRSLSTPSTKHYNIRYVNGSSGTNLSFRNSKVAWYSTDDGDTFSQANFTPDIWITEAHTGQSFRIGIYAKDILDNTYKNLTLKSDVIGQINYSISSPNIQSYYYGKCSIYDMASCAGVDEAKNGTHSGWMSIHINTAVDGDAVGTVNHTLYLMNTDGSLNYTINNSFYSFDDSDLHVNFNTSLVPDGKYRMNISARADDVATDIQSRLTDSNFSIDNTPPIITNLRNTSTTNQSSFIEWDCSESCNYTITLFNNSARTNTYIFDILYNNSFATSHYPYWNNFTNGTTYYINLTVRDSSGNNASNNTFNFTTAMNLGCAANWVNTSWGAWNNETGCQLNDSTVKRTNLTQYDDNYCVGSSNTTFYNYSNDTCNYCSYLVVNTSWSSPVTNYSECLSTNLQNLSQNKTEYDSHKFNCSDVTGIDADLWNSGVNNTYYTWWTNMSCNYLGCPTITSLRNTSTTNISTFIEWTCSESCNYSITWFNNTVRNDTYLIDSIYNNTFAVTQNPFLVNLSNFTSYYLNLTVWDDFNCSVSNNTFNFTTALNIVIVVTNGTPTVFIDSYGIEWVLLNWTNGDTMTLEYSKDNATSWVALTNIDNTDDKAYQLNLDAKTKYYFRAKNTTSEYAYVNQKTKVGGLKEMEIALVIGTSIIVILFIVLTFATKADKPFLANFFFLGIFIFATVLSNLIWKITAVESAAYEPIMLTIYRIMLVITMLMIFIVLVILTNDVVQIRKIKGNPVDHYRDNLGQNE